METLQKNLRIEMENESRLGSLLKHTTPKHFRAMTKLRMTKSQNFLKMRSASVLIVNQPSDNLRLNPNQLNTYMTPTGNAFLKKIHVGSQSSLPSTFKKQYEIMKKSSSLH